MSTAAPAVERRVDDDGRVRETRPASCAGRLAGADRGPPPRLHRLGHLRGQPGPHRRQHPAPGPPARHRRGPRGRALLQGLATCGRCGRASPCTTRAPTPPPATTAPTGHWSTAAASGCLRVGGARRSTRPSPPRSSPRSQPAGVHACLAAAEATRSRPRRRPRPVATRQVERARYEAARAERRYLAVDPDNRLVARGLEADWEAKLAALADAEAELARRQAARPRTLTDDERAHASRARRRHRRACGRRRPPPTGTARSCCAPCSKTSASTSRRDDRPTPSWSCAGEGGAITELGRRTARRPPPAIRTDEDTIDLLRRLAVHYPDATIAGILNRQGRRSATEDCHSPPPSSRRCATTGASPATSPRRATRRRAAHRHRRRQRARRRTLHRAPLARRRLHRRRAAHPRRPLADPPHRRAAQPASSTTPRRAGWPCSKPPSPSACPARPCCSVSSAASSKPSTSAPDAEKACESSVPSTTDQPLRPDNQRKEQCDDARRSTP